MSSQRVDEFFDDSSDFWLDEEESITDEFVRLADQRGMTVGSRTWRRRWLACFGVPYRPADDEYFRYYPDFIFNETRSIDQNFARLAYQNGWQPGSAVYREEYDDCMKSFFTMHYGDSTDKLAEWQKICEDASIQPIPSSINKCKKALGDRKLFINLVDMIQYREHKKNYDRREAAGQLQAHEQPPPLPQRFPSRNAFVKYTKKIGKTFPRDAAKENGFVNVLLRKLPH